MWSEWWVLFVGGPAIVGLYLSIYFTLLTYGVASPRAPLVPRVCRLDEQSCGTVVNTPAARLFAGIPNSVLGIIYYGFVLVVLAADLWARPGVLLVLTGAAAVTVVSGVYLVIQLYRVMRVSCPLCVAVHVINLLLAVMFGLRLGAVGLT